MSHEFCLQECADCGAAGPTWASWWCSQRPTGLGRFDQQNLMFEYVWINQLLKVSLKVSFLTLNPEWSECIYTLLLCSAGYWYFAMGPDLISGPDMAIPFFWDGLMFPRTCSPKIEGSVSSSLGTSSATFCEGRWSSVKYYMRDFMKLMYQMDAWYGKTRLKLMIFLGGARFWRTSTRLRNLGILICEKCCSAVEDMVAWWHWTMV